MIADPIHHSVTALRCRLMEGAPDLSPLRVLEERRIEWAGWNVTFFILGASHAVRFEGPGGGFTELLTCLPPAGGHALLDVPAVEATSLVREVCGLWYRAGLRVHALSGLPPLLGRPDAEMAHRFPAAGPTDNGEAPFTWVGWRAEAERLTVETLHTYPEEGRAVHSRSEFRVPAEGVNQ